MKPFSYLFRPTFVKRILFFVSADLFLGVLTLYSAYALRFNFAIPSYFLDHFWRVSAVLLTLKIVSFFLFKIYYKSWRFFGLQDLKQLILAHVVAYSVYGIIFLAAEEWFNPMPRSAVIIDFFLSIIALGGLRISKRLLLETSGVKEHKKAIVVGTSGRASGIIKSALTGEIPYYPVAVLDPTGEQAGTYIENLPVVSVRKLKEIVQKLELEAALIAENFEAKELDTIVETFNDLGVSDLKRVSLLSGTDEPLRNISIEDLLAREPKDLDIETIKSFVHGRCVLVTGAGGSIGSEICRQLVGFGVEKLIMLDNAEYNLYKITEEIDPKIGVPKLVSVLEIERLENIFANFQPQIVIHAAAYKHVPLCEVNEEEAVRNNIIGVMNVINLSISYGAKKVVNISSDKAVRPTNVMGATKRVGELYAQNIFSGNTEIVSVRFGNVLGSSGSVVPKFREQIEKGGPVTVTHPEITRYFMLIDEACRLVLQAAAIAEGGELFILDMGEPVKIADLAKKMIRLYGKEGEVEIAYTGLRPGEKLFEELLIDDAECKTRYESIYVAKSTYYDFEKLQRDIKELLDVSDKRKILKRIIPEYLRRKADRFVKPGSPPPSRD